MTESRKQAEKELAEDPTPEDTSSGDHGDWDRSDPHQQEVTRILDEFEYDLMGIIHMSEDGIMRSLTADRTVLSAQGFSKPPCRTDSIMQGQY